LLAGLGNGRTERAAVVLGVVNDHVTLRQGLTSDVVYVPMADAERIGAEFD